MLVIIASSISQNLYCVLEKIYCACVLIRLINASALSKILVNSSYEYVKLPDGNLYKKYLLKMDPIIMKNLDGTNTYLAPAWCDIINGNGETLECYKIYYEKVESNNMKLTFNR